MGNRFYRTIRLLGVPIAYRCLNTHNLPTTGPAIYIANHLGSVGPVQALLACPTRLYMWIRAEMMDHRRAPRYLYDDFVHPTWHLNGRFGLAVATLVSRIAIVVFHGIDAIAVEDRTGLHVTAFHRSMALLSSGESLLIFPEDPSQPAESDTGLSPFLGGFVQLSRLYRRQTGAALPIVPVGISIARRALLVGRPIWPHGDCWCRGPTDAACRETRDRVAELVRTLEESAPVLKPGLC